jgi:hypothetical protein
LIVPKRVFDHLAALGEKRRGAAPRGDACDPIWPRSRDGTRSGIHCPCIASGSHSLGRLGACGLTPLQATHERRRIGMKMLTRWAEKAVAGRVIAELIFAEEARSDRGTALGTRHVRIDPGLLAGLDVLDLEIAPRQPRSAPHREPFLPVRRSVPAAPYPQLGSQPAVRRSACASRRLRLARYRPRQHTYAAPPLGCRGG